MLRALIFDFDGVLVDSEPVILRLTQEMAAREGWKVSAEEYYRDYLALDDRGIVERLYHSHGRAVDPQRRDDLVAWKARNYRAITRKGLPSFPGAADFVRGAAARYPLVIASGSLRNEIESLLEKLQLRESFRFIISAEDTERSKPNPEIYLKALARLQELSDFQSTKLHASECLAIEDAPGGIQAARAAGLRCLALAQSRPKQELSQADWVYAGFHEVDLEWISRQVR